MKAFDAIAMLFLALIPGVAAADESGGCGVRLFATVSTDTAGTPHLTFTVGTMGNQKLEIYERSLPWKSPNAISLFAAEARLLGDALEYRRAIADGPSNVVTLVPGRPVHGEVELLKVFPNLQQVLRESDVAVFWVYVPILKAHGKTQPMAFPACLGHIRIPRANGTVRR